jgi:cobalt-zinc-cadmium efflux system outer membrane protein
MEGFDEKTSRSLPNAISMLAVTCMHMTIVIVMALALSPTKLVGMDRNRARDVADSLSRVFDQDISSQVFDPDGRLSHYLSYAAKNNPEVRASYYQWVAQLEKAGYAGALPDPMISYGRFIESVETRVGPQEHRLGLSQPYPWFGTLGARRDVEFEASNAAFKRFQADRLRLFYQVKAAYCELYYLGRNIDITRENMELLAFWESVARAAYRVGLKKYPVVIKAQVELGKLEDRLLSLESSIEPVRARLRAALNIADTTTLPLPSAIEITEAELSRDSLIALTEANNPSLGAIRHTIDKEAAGVRLAGKSSFPSFTFGVDYLVTGEALNPSMPESGKDAWGLSVSMNLPIWFGKNKAKKNEARALYRAATESYEETGNQLTSLVELKLFEYDDALRKVRLYRDGLVPKAGQSLNAFYTAYQAGEADFLSVLDAQRQLLEFQLQYERSLTDLAKRKAELEMLTGTEL